MSDVIAAAHALTKRFGAKTALEELSVEVRRGDIVGVLGKNGAGKTTLLELLLGFGPPTAGSAEAFGENSLELSESAKSRIGFVPQQDELVGLLTGRQQIAITAAFHERWDGALIDRLVDEWAVPVDSRVQSMSVGERQKMSVALALGHRPELLVLDEPVASLDPIARRGFLKQLLDVAETEKRAVVFSSHIVSDLERAANRLWILKDGRMLWQGGVDTLKESIVRLHVHARAALPAELDVPHALTSRVDGAHAVVVASEWTDARRAELERRLGASVEVEPLGLEEIFIEMHA